MVAATSLTAYFGVEGSAHAPMHVPQFIKELARFQVLSQCDFMVGVYPCVPTSVLFIVLLWMQRFHSNLIGVCTRTDCSATLILRRIADIHMSVNESRCGN
eukprot:6175916-Pleurochrysis_carterae.AAC.2